MDYTPPEVKAKLVFGLMWVLRLPEKFALWVFVLLVG
jgi:hypothetical protein